MKIIKYIIYGLIFFSVIGFAGSYLVDENLNMMENDIYNVTNVNATTLNIETLCLNSDCTFNMSNNCTYYPGGDYIC